MDIQKEYKISEPKLIELAKKYAKLITKFSSPLSELNSNLSIDFQSSFGDDLVSLNSIPDGKASVMYLKEKKNNVEKVREECIRLFKKVHYFVMEAFPTNLEMLENFGFNELSSSMRTTNGLISFLSEFQQTCLIFLDDLKLAGFTDEYIQEIERLRTKLIVANSELLKLKREPKKFEEQRIHILNKLWFKIRSVHRAASLVFEGNEKVLEEFHIPEPTFRKFTKQVFSFFHISFGGYSY